MARIARADTAGRAKRPTTLVRRGPTANGRSYKQSGFGQNFARQNAGTYHKAGAANAAHGSQSNPVGNAGDVIRKTNPVDMLFNAIGENIKRATGQR